MTSCTNSKNIDIDIVTPYLPYNRGYIINGRKIYGHQETVKNCTNMKLISSDNHIHTWLRRGYVEKKLNADETEYDGLLKSKRRVLISSRSMMPCPNELNNYGICTERHDPNHRNFFYHFTKYDRNDNIVTRNNMVVCRYKKHGKWNCWEKQNGHHAKVFTHV